MHARRHHWVTYTLIATVALALGCRGSRPLASNRVKISQEQSEMPDVNPPRQRLAVNKQVDDDTATQARPPVRDDNPHNRLASNRRPTSQDRAKAASHRRPASDTVNTLTDRAQPAKKEVANSDAKTKSPSPAQPASQSVAQMTTNVDKMSEKEMTEAFESQPEDVKRLAMQQLSAIKQSAERTSQPAGLDSAIANSVNDLPDLKPAGVRAQLPTKRIAAGESSETNTPSQNTNQTAVAQATATADSSETAQSHGANASISDVKNPDRESVVVQTISDQSDDGSVQPVSGSRPLDEGPMVAQASPTMEPSPSKNSPSSQAVATAEAPAATSVSPQTPSQASAAVDGSQLSDDALYAELLRRLEKAPADESEADRSSRLIKQRHLMVLAGDADAAMKEIEDMSVAEQEFMRHQLLGLSTILDPQGHPVPSRRFTTALPHIREATKFAAAATDSLEVRSLAFCTSIESYGQVKTFPGNRFEPGQQVILYCEVENFTVAENADGFETHLQGSYDVYNSKNEKVVSQLLPADQQTSANYLRDYFIAYQMHLPQQLDAGTYRLQLTMEDVTGKKYGQANIPFEIAK